MGKKKDEWHSLTNIDKENKVATCLQCGPNTPLRYVTERDIYICMVYRNQNNQKHMARAYEQNAKKQWAYRLKKHFHMTPEQFFTMLEKQGGCAICTTTDPGVKSWCVDHDHSCCPTRFTCGNCIRGILCSKCNLIIGQFEDREDILLNAINYLKKEKNEF